MPLKVVNVYDQVLFSFSVRGVLKLTKRCLILRLLIFNQNTEYFIESELCCSSSLKQQI